MDCWRGNSKYRWDMKIAADLIPENRTKTHTHTHILQYVHTVFVEERQTVIPNSALHHSSHHSSHNYSHNYSHHQLPQTLACTQNYHSHPLVTVCSGWYRIIEIKKGTCLSDLIANFTLHL